MLSGKVCCPHYAASLTPDEVRLRLRELDAGRLQMKGEKQSAVTAQLAGLRAGASPEAYAAVFEGIAAQRPGRKAQGACGSPDRSKPRKTDGRTVKTGERTIIAGLLRSALAVLSDPAVPGAEKRTALSPIVERVICRKGGADVFAPGLFEGFWGKNSDFLGKDGILSGEAGARQTYQTTCIGINTHK